MVALNARLQLLRTGQRQQEALVDLFTALAEKARDISRVISAGDGLGNTSGAQNADGEAADFVVQWNTDDGSGRMTANDTSYCWDTVANGQVNLETCP